MFNKKKKTARQGGFTLIEMMIVIVIMTIVYSISMGSYANMGKKTDLENTVYSLALTIREVQYYGINKKLKSPDFSDNDPYPFGIHLDKEYNDGNKDDNVGSGKKRAKLVVFTDLDTGGGNDSKFNGDCQSIGDLSKECRKLIELPKNIKIKEIQLRGAGSGTWLGKETLDDDGFNILFKRPDPDAKIVKESDPSTVYSGVRIFLESTGGFEGAVEVGAAGDISVVKN